MNLSKETSIEKVLQMIPKSKDVFKKFGLDCAGCLGADSATLESVARSNGIKVEKLLDELKKIDLSNKGGG